MTERCQESQYFHIAQKNEQQREQTENDEYIFSVSYQFVGGVQ